MPTKPADRDPPATAGTRLDHLAHDIDNVLAAIRREPTGPVARDVRDTLRRAHEIGVRRNFIAVMRLLAVLPDSFLPPLVRQAHRRPAQRLYLAVLRVSGRLPDHRPR